MSDYVVLRQVALGPTHQRTGKTRHYVGQQLLPEAATLLIVKYEDELGLYLLHLDRDGKELTDTYHETTEDALAQAEWEYQVKSGDWKIVDRSH